MENILGDDIYKTQYHGGPYQHWMNEPHGPLYYNGLYHPFYQANPVGTCWRNICWGHLVSEDMVNWRPIKEAITPTRGSEVQMAPIKALHTLEEEVLIDEKDLTMDEANAALSGVDEDMLYLRATLAPADSARFGLALKQGGERDRTAYTVDPAAGKVSGETSNTGDGAATNMTSGPLTLTEDGKLQMELYIDRSLAEAFFNNTKSISIRAYGDAASTGLTFFTEGIGLTVEELYAARMGSIYD